MPGRSAKNLPPGFHVPESTLSLDGDLGVIVPDFKHYKEDGPPQNQLVDMHTGRALATIHAPSFFEDPETNMNQVDLEAGWSHDGSVLAWVLGGKWFPTACVLLKVQDGEVAWQTDVLTRVQQRILAETKAAAPENYAAARKQNQGNGNAYPDGFSVNLDPPKAGFTLPWKGQATLDSNVKGLTDGWPAQANVYATMDFVVKEDGTMAFSNFALDPEQTGVPRGAAEDAAAPESDSATETAPEASAAPKTGDFGTIFSFPTENPQVRCEIPASWNPKQTGDKVEAISDDGLVILTVEGLDPESVDAKSTEDRSLLDGDGLGLKTPVTAEDIVAVNGIDTSTTTTKGSDDNGPCTVTQQTYMVSENVSLLVTFVVSDKARKANAKTIAQIRQHITPTTVAAD